MSLGRMSLKRNELNKLLTKILFPTLLKIIIACVLLYQWELHNTNLTLWNIALLAGAVKYAGWTSADGVRPPPTPNEGPGYHIKPGDGEALVLEF